MLTSFGKAFAGDEHRSFTWRNTEHKVAVLIHGFPGTPAEMQPIAMCLHEAGWGISAPLLPGFGAEIDNLHTYSFRDWKQAVQQEVIQLSKKHNQVILLGYSMGGALAIQVAAEAKIDALILLAPFWRMSNAMWKLIPLFKPIFPHIKPFKIFKADFSNPNLRAGILNWFPKADLDNPDIQKQIQDLTIPLNLFDQIRLAGKHAANAAYKVNVPTLVFQGNQDELVSAQQTRKLLVDFSGPVRYIELEANHNLLEPFSANWQIIQQHTLDFASNYLSNKH